MKTPVAIYSARGALKGVTLLLAVVLLIFGATLYSPDGRSIAPRPSGLPEFQIIAWICGALGLLFLSVFLWRLLFDKRAAIWIENGRIIHLHKWYQSVDRDNVEEIVAETIGWADTPAIVIRTRDGSKMELPTAALSEPSEVIVARLKETLARS